MKKTFVLGILTIVFAVVITALNPALVQAKMSIPKDAFEYNGHYYYYYKGTKSWKDAQSVCKKLGGHLVTFSNAKEEKAVWEYITSKKHDTPAWIGMYNNGLYDSTYGKYLDEWKWVGKEKIKYENWANNEPNQSKYPGYDTVDLYAAIGKGTEVCSGNDKDTDHTPAWGDFDEKYSVDKGIVKGYICEWDIYTIAVKNAPKTMAKGDKVKLTYTITDKATGSTLKKATATFKSTNTKVAKVAKDGTITAVKKGTCTIKVVYKGCVKKIKITVK